MSVDANPYAAPPEIRAAEESSGQESGGWGIAFWSGVVLALIGLIAAFLPNAPPLGFMLVALFLFVVVSFGSARYRKRAVVCVLLCITLGVGTVHQIRSAQVDRVRQQALRSQMIAEKAAMEAARASVEQAMRAQSELSTRP